MHTHARTLVDTACLVAVNTLLAFLALAWFAPAPANAAPTRPCEYEDSVACVWDARHMGNGIGRSFIVSRTGHVKYVTHRRAHRLIHSTPAR